ncbi:MAG TPA: rRNA maturation RNase YbeY [Chitinophagaceae bacterium]
MASKSKVYFFFETPFSFSGRKQLKLAVEQVFQKEKIPISSLNYIFCTDMHLLEINRQYLKHDYYTDIITFDLSGKNEPVIGEVYISVDRVRENAKALGIPLSNELYRVVFHGALHLCGYNDKTKRQTTIMRERENHYITLLTKDLFHVKN